MKRGGWLKRKTPMPRFKGEISNKPVKRTLALVAKDDAAQTKKRIQAKLREKAIKRDGGCVLRGYQHETIACSQVLQAEHLNSRSHSATFADMRNIVCLCTNHHLRYKPQNSRRYWELIREVIGEARYLWLQDAERNNHRPCRMTAWDWQKIEIALNKDL